MPSKQFAVKKEEPANLFFKQNAPSEVLHKTQNVQIFSEIGDTSLMDSSTEHGCLVFAC
jgi:hypothetical protein